MFLGIDEKKESMIAAISDEGKRLTYGQLKQCTIELKKKIGSKNLVFVLCKNRIATLVGYVGLMASENVPVLLSADMDSELLMELYEKYRPNYIWCPQNMRAQLDLSFFTTEKNCIYDFDDYMLLQGFAGEIEMYEQLALLLTTSGSTGSPKFVRQSLKNVLSNAEAIAKYLELDETERPITMLPMNYTYGLSVINSHLLVGATILMTESSYAQKLFWDFFKSQGATSIVGVPFTYEILKKLRFFKMELPSLRYMTQAGGKLLPELHKEYAEYAKRNNIRFYVMYGQTEATARMSYLPYEKSLEKYGSMGVAIPGGEFSLVDLEGEIISEFNVVGELVYKGDNVTLGYAECLEDLLKGDERGGVLFTGDMAKQDEDGFYYIVGRKKRFLKIFGNRVNLDECERLIQSFAEECECACVGSDDNMIIYVNVKGMEKDIVDYISQKTGLNKKAFEVRYIDEIPKNESGKKQYNLLNINCSL